MHHFTVLDFWTNNVTGFAETVLIGTTTEIKFIAYYTLALSRHTKHMDIDSQVCFNSHMDIDSQVCFNSQMGFPKLVKP